jgi:hypothetical protein
VLDVLDGRDGKMFWIYCRKDRRERERERARAGKKEREHGWQGQGTAFGPAAGEWATKEIANCSLG